MEDVLLRGLDRRRRLRGFDDLGKDRLNALLRHLATIEERGDRGANTEHDDE